MTAWLLLYFLVTVTIGASWMLVIGEGLDDPDDDRPAHVRRRVRQWAPFGVALFAMLWPVWTGLALFVWAVDPLVERAMKP